MCVPLTFFIFDSYSFGYKIDRLKAAATPRHIRLDKKTIGKKGFDSYNRPGDEKLGNIDCVPIFRRKK